MGEDRQHLPLGAGERGDEFDRRAGIDVCIAAQAKHPRHLQFYRRCRFEIFKTLVAEIEKAAGLPQRKARGLRAGNEIVVDDLVAPGDADPPQMSIVEIALRQRFISLGAEQGAADRRRIEIGDIELDIRIVRPRKRLFVGARAVGSAKKHFDVAIGQGQPSDHAFVEHIAKTDWFEFIAPNLGRRPERAAVDKAEFCPRDRQSRGQHRLVDDAHRGRGLGYAVKHGDAAAILADAAGVSGGIHRNNEGLIEAFAIILRDELPQ